VVAKHAREKSVKSLIGIGLNSNKFKKQESSGQYAFWEFLYTK
jgi:hypothetical protein